jgi:hypothetical protein
VQAEITKSQVMENSGMTQTQLQEHPEPDKRDPCMCLKKKPRWAKVINQAQVIPAVMAWIWKVPPTLMCSSLGCQLRGVWGRLNPEGSGFINGLTHWWSHNLMALLGILPEKWSWKFTSVLASSKRRIQARCKNSVKVTVKFIRNGYTSNRGKAGCL